LGNIRVSYTLNPADGQLKILEENHYYPFGLKHSNYNKDKADFDKDETGFFVVLKPVERSDYQYKYNGKEFQDELNLNWYDYQARNYDPAISRWMNIDPLAETSRRFSPYTYCLNNPLRFIDPDGMEADDIIVLNNPKGAGGFGHMAMLVGDDKNGWTFISKEGRNKEPLYSNEVTGGPALTPLIKTFNTLDDFRTAQSENKNLGGYTQELRLETTKEQDEAAKEATTESAGSWYNVGFSNCADAVSDGLEAAGLEPGNVTSNEGLFSATALPSKPNARFDAISTNNADKIKPTEPVKKTENSKAN
jgi:RHS repeat-associated protein